MTTVARTCSVEGCEKKHTARGFCAAHYRRHRNGESMELRVTLSNDNRVCDWYWCTRPSRSAGYCDTHYVRKTRNQDMDAPFKSWRVGSCTHPGCKRPYSNNGYCELHARRAAKGTDMDAPVRKAKIFSKCLIGGCRGKHESYGLCQNHSRTSRNYKLSPLQLIMAYEQGCALCNQKDNLHIDHDHKCCPTHRNTCGECIRGVLCGSCNTGLGHLKDNVDILRAAILYLS